MASCCLAAYGCYKVGRCTCYYEKCEKEKEQEKGKEGGVPDMRAPRRAGDAAAAAGRGGTGFPWRYHVAYIFLKRLCSSILRAHRRYWCGKRDGAAGSMAARRPAYHRALIISSSALWRARIRWRAAQRRALIIKMKNVTCWRSLAALARPCRKRQVFNTITQQRKHHNIIIISNMKTGNKQ